MSPSKSHATRLLHLAILLIVLFQLASSQIMERPLPGEEAELPMIWHQWAGTGAVAALTLFWIWTMVRDYSETSLSQLFPWFTSRGRASVIGDALSPFQQLAARRLPSFHLPALASAVHGAGLALASFLALTGASWYFVLAETPWGRPVLGLHSLAGNLMWVYVVGHALMGASHQLLGNDVFSRMFWVRDGRAGLPLAPAE